MNSKTADETADEQELINQRRKFLAYTYLKKNYQWLEITLEKHPVISDCLIDRTYENLAKLQEKFKLSVKLIRVATKRAMQSCYRQLEIQKRATKNYSDIVASRTSSSVEADHEEEFDNRELNLMYRRIVSRLPAYEANLIFLRERGMTVREIAKEIGKSKSKVDRDLNALIEKIKQKLGVEND